MKIKSIHIKNVRGLGDHKAELNMIPNKPSLLVAPNGSGKSSFACAFNWLNRQRIKLDPEDAYQGEVANKPVLIIETTDPDKTYIADENQNKINSAFGVFVINSSLKASSPGMKDGVHLGKARLTVPEIVIIDKVVINKPNIQDDFDVVYDLEGAPQGTYPKINDLLNDNRFMANIECEKLKCKRKEFKKLVEFVAKSKEYEGTKDERHAKIETYNSEEIKRIPCIAYAIDIIKQQCPDDNAVRLLVKAVKVVLLYHKEENFKKRIEYSQYKIEEESCKQLFETLKNTWKDIKPHRERDKVILRISDAQRISNGERDILTFLANLWRSKSQLTKKYNILIIDEVFDYLDDANMIAVQYYITKFIKEFKDEGRFLFPIILSHLNPDYYRQHYSFKDLKVYYLCPLPYPNASDNMIKLLRTRKGLAKAVDVGKEEDISKYMLHYHNDYTKDMSGLIGDCPATWKDIKVFKKYCSEQLDAYIANNRYDPLAVCVALREIIEKNIYDKLATTEQKETYIKIHGTNNKLQYAAEEENVNVPELYYLLGNIYNDPMHVDDKSQKSITQTLYSRLENNTIRTMIESIKNDKT